MASENLSENVLHFIETSIDSVEQLRVLLLLHSEPTKIWSVAEISSEVRSVETSISRRLKDLYSRKVLLRIPQKPELHGYLPASTDIEVVVRELVEENRLRPYSVIEAIYSRKTSPIKDFADAFKLRGDK